MTYAQVINEARQLSLTEKLDLVEALLHDLRQSVMQPGNQPLTTEDRLRIVDQLGGMLKPESGSTPTDAEIRDDYSGDLIRKSAQM
jgi:hypothetical protein